MGAAGNFMATASETNREQMKAQKEATTAGGWVCSCGAKNTGRFCAECGKPKPEEGWTCSCGAKNTGKFCSECGKPRLADSWVCSCGAKNPASAKFCGDCGTKHD